MMVVREPLDFRLVVFSYPTLTSRDAMAQNCGYVLHPAHHHGHFFWAWAVEALLVAIGFSLGLKFTSPLAAREQACSTRVSFRVFIALAVVEVGKIGSLQRPFHLSRWEMFSTAVLNDKTLSDDLVGFSMTRKKIGVAMIRWKNRYWSGLPSVFWSDFWPKSAGGVAIWADIWNLIRYLADFSTKVVSYFYLAEEICCGESTSGK